MLKDRKMQKVTLYIAIHNKTGKKYFGKTAKYFSEKDLQKYYHGSGVYWKNHLKKYGDDVTMKIYKICNINEVEKEALRFSKENDIINSNEWANLKFENGLDGWGCGDANPSKFMTNEWKYKCGNAFRNKKRPDHSKRMKGQNNPMFGKNFQIKKAVEKAKMNSGKKYEEIFGEEKAKKIKNKLKKILKGKKHNLKEFKCPFCCKIGKGPNMKRYHFENCKLNYNNKENVIGIKSNLVQERYKKIKCEYCGKIVSKGNYVRWHGKNCKKAKNETFK